jgi:hypothetical protein
MRVTGCKIGEDANTAVLLVADTALGSYLADPSP